MSRLFPAVLLVLCCSACAALRPLPLDDDAYLGLGSATERSGVLHYRSPGSPARTFLLALRTDGAVLELAVVTPQAVPLYRVLVQGGARTVANKLAGQGEPGADELVRALLLMYGTPAELERQLNPGWSLRVTDSGRSFHRDEGEPVIAIEYEGEPPWYREARLNDAGAGTILSVQWLEQHDLLPQ